LAMHVGESRVCKVEAFPYLAIAASRIYMRHENWNVCAAHGQGS